MSWGILSFAEQCQHTVCWRTSLCLCFVWYSCIKKKANNNCLAEEFQKMEEIYHHIARKWQLVTFAHAKNGPTKKPRNCPPHLDHGTIIHHRNLSTSDVHIASLQGNFVCVHMFQSSSFCATCSLVIALLVMFESERQSIENQRWLDAGRQCHMFLL